MSMEEDTGWIEGHELENIGFESRDQYWYKDNIRLALDEGRIIWIAEGDNYHGLSVRIYTITELQVFMHFISKYTLE